jgi:GNAT superfamily N-acetyltransferase
MPDPPVHLRPARPDEAEALTRLCLRSKAHWGYDAAFMAACRPELTLAGPDLDPARLAVLAEAGDPALGPALGLVEIALRGAACDLEKLFVDPPALRRGHGTRLFDWAVARARAQGATHMRIEADPGARGFYEARGAVLIGTAPSGAIPGRRLPLLRLDLT